MNDMTTEKQNKRPNVPPLRFPEFTEPWERTKLGNHITIYSGSSPNLIIDENGEIPYYKVEQLNWCNKFLSDTPYLSKRNKLTLPPNCIVFSKRGAAILTNKVRINPFAINIDTNLMGLSVNDSSSLDYNFLYYFILKAELGKIADTSTIPQINNIHINPLIIPIPSIGEQRKVAKFISLLDRRIAVQSKIIEQLESLMGGIIERLTAQSANVRILDCLECHSSTLQENQLNEVGKCHVYGANGVCGYTDYPAINGDSILIVKDGSGVGNVSFATGEYSVIGTLNYLIAKNGYNLRYLYYCLKNFNFGPYKTGMAIPHIYFKDYGKAKIFCPALEEQERIANILSKIEHKIVIERSITDHYIQQKQYLLQQMFI